MSVLLELKSCTHKTFICVWLFVSLSRRIFGRIWHILFENLSLNFVDINISSVCLIDKALKTCGICWVKVLKISLLPKCFINLLTSELLDRHFISTCIKWRLVHAVGSFSLFVLVHVESISVEVLNCGILLYFLPGRDWFFVWLI